MAVKRDALEGKVVRGAQPLLGVERDEIAEMVSRIKRADARTRAPVQHTVSAASVRNEDLQWATEWQLPKEMFDYFIVERA